MSVMIGSARIDENGKISGGKAGDQTGKEVSAQAWYKHNKGWVVLRPKNSGVADLIADDMQYACNNPHIGYDQSQRNTLYTLAEKEGFDCEKITKNCETDCSALVRVCCAYAGIRVKDFNTSTEKAVLMATGHFIELTSSIYTTKSEYLKRGDILITKTKGHTAVVLTNGPRSSLDSDTKVCITGNAVFIRKGPDKTYSPLGVARMGETFSYAGVTQNGWHNIYYGRDKAWVSGKLSKLV